MLELSNLTKKKYNGTIKCDKSMVIFDVDIVHCNVETIKRVFGSLDVTSRCNVIPLLMMQKISSYVPRQCRWIMGWIRL